MKTDNKLIQNILFSCEKQKSHIAEQVVPEHVLTYVVSGNVEFQFDTEIFTAMPDDIVIIRRNKLVKATKIPYNATTPCKTINIFLTQSVVNNYALQNNINKQGRYTMWSTEGGKWVGESKTTYDERNNKGDVVVYSNYSWENDQWNKTSYTVSYPKNYFPTGTEAIASSAYVWNNGGNLHVRTGKASTLYIYTISGALYRQQTITAGETIITALPKGVYIVAFGNNERQKVLIN